MSSYAEVMQAYGVWVASLAPWREMWTMTHDAKRLADPTWTRVGVKHHRATLRLWFHEVVRRDDRSAQWWSELEYHATGQPHEHGMLAHDPAAPWLRWRTEWWNLTGYAFVRPVRDGGAGAAAYASKYAGKATSLSPCVWGFGVEQRESWRIVHPTLGGVV